MSPGMIAALVKYGIPIAAVIIVVLGLVGYGKHTEAEQWREAERQQRERVLAWGHTCGCDKELLSNKGYYHPYSKSYPL